ncbi:MAG TPA: c-type cytochrome [Terriglobales bacterium]|nr:c-type cytochrome [Terriglobales bacterium]
MERTIAALAAFVLLFCALGCNEQVTNATASSAPPMVKIPVGPIPGPQVPLNLPTDPYIGNQIALREGRRLFVWYNCSGCHGGRGGGGMGPSLRDPVWIYGGDDAHVFASIAEGRAKGMPAWGTKIPQDQIWKLVAYIKSMRTPDEPDPPSVPAQPEVKRATE